MRFGAHVPVGDGYEHAVAYAVQVGCECLQVFAKSPRQWQAAPLDPGRAAAFVEAREAASVGPLFTHTAYLLNLSTPDPVIREKSIQALADELQRAVLLGAEGVVTHVGNDPDGDPAAAAARVGEAVLRAMEGSGGPDRVPRLLLENTAGAGRTFGGSFTELGACINESGLPANTLGVCLDTCHAFAYGMPVDSVEGWDEVVTSLDVEVGVDRLGLIHANDCLFERGSRRDRHAWIGDGFIGETGFSAMVCHPALSDVCACLEVPGEPPLKDAENIARLKRLRGGCAPSQEAG